MSKWDITPSGVEFVTSLVGDAIDDIDTGVRSYGKHVESAATSAGTLSEPVCGAPQTGPVGAALALFVEKSMREALFIGARAVKSANGAREATALYVAGHHRMAADAQHAALSAPKIDMPGDGKRGGGHK